MLKSSNYLNENGLVNGNIPAGQECPFHSECKLLSNNCPTKDNGNIRSHEFSCAAARAWSMVKKTDCRSLKQIVAKE